VHSNRDPIRDIRNKHHDNTDRFADFHERRVNPEQEVRAGEDNPLAVIHIAPKLAFTKAATRFTVPDLLNRDVRLHTGSNRPQRPDLKHDRVTSTTDPAPKRGKGGKEVNLYENAVLEFITARTSYEKGNGRIISDTSLINSIAGNLAIVLSLLAERRQDQNVLMTATFIGFDGAKFKPNRPTRPVTDEYIQAPVLSFGGLELQEDETDSTYDIRTEQLKELFRPLFHSTGRKDLPMEIPETLDLPDLSVDE